MNECYIDNGGCDLIMVCMNFFGGFECGPCLFGYEGDGDVGCTDLSVCVEGIWNYDMDPVMVCIVCDFCVVG